MYVYFSFLNISNLIFQKLETKPNQNQSEPAGFSNEPEFIRFWTRNKTGWHFLTIIRRALCLLHILTNFLNFTYSLLIVQTTIDKKRRWSLRSQSSKHF